MLAPSEPEPGRDDTNKRAPSNEVDFLITFHYSVSIKVSTFLLQLRPLMDRSLHTHTLAYTPVHTRVFVIYICCCSRAS